MDVRVAARFAIGLVGIGSSAGLAGCSYDWDGLSSLASGGDTSGATTSAAGGSGGTATTGGSGGTSTTGGSGGTATMSGSGGLGGSGGSCTSGTVNLCEQVPQAMDSVPVDVSTYPFCKLPVARFTLNVEGLYNDTSDTPWNSRTEGPDIRMGWVTDGVVLHIEVPDKSVKPFEWDGSGNFLPYRGDSIEVFLKGDDMLTGDYNSMGGDIGAIHLVMIPPHQSYGGPWSGECKPATEACVVQFIEGAGSKKIDDSIKFKGGLLPDGYEFYAYIPWGALGGATPGKGQHIAVTFAWNQSATGTKRDFQLYYGLNPMAPADSMYCPGSAKPDCDDRAFCTPLLE